MHSPREVKTTFVHVGSLGTYRILSTLSTVHLFHANLAKINSDYLRLYSQLSMSQYTIMDSGSFELALGTTKSDTSELDFLDLALTTGAREIICPDCPFDPHKSTLVSKDFIAKWKRLPNTYRPRLMVVPHGRTLSEWYSNAAMLVAGAQECTIGIPRILCDMVGTVDPSFRLQVAMNLRKKIPNHHVHLLGAGKSILEELELLKKVSAGIVRSLDSTFILRYTSAGSTPERGYAHPVPLQTTSTPNNFVEQLDTLAGYFGH
jgi:hypothetical protein